MSDKMNERQKTMQEQDERIKEQLSKIKNIFIVMSGKGGVGKSTVAVNLAVGLAKKGLKVGLMDVDLHGPSTLKMLGLEGKPMGASGEQLIPIDFNKELTVVSMAALLENQDSAVIWRGPLKIGAIRQFISDVRWDKLDYLIIDAPPGTGDEPLTVAQVIPRAKGIIVTTPQDVSILDIRKSVTFCRQLKMEIFGIIENMGSFNCPHCGEKIELFSSGGGKETATEMNVPFLGSIPFIPGIVKSCDQGKPYILSQNNEFDGFDNIVENIANGGNK